MKITFERFVTEDIGEMNFAPALAKSKRGKKQVNKKD